MEAPEPAPAQAETAAAEIDYRAALLALLGLDESADTAAIEASSAELKARAEKAAGQDGDVAYRGKNGWRIAGGIVSCASRMSHIR